MQTSFPLYLDKLLAHRGAAAELARASGVSSSMISRIAEGKVIPEVATFAALLQGLTQADRNALTVEYLLLHRPEIAAEVQVIVGTPEDMKDRLTRACEKLDATTREALATIIEGVNRAPDQGIAWIRSMAALFIPPIPSAELAAETTLSLPVTEPRVPVRYRKPRR
jgi:transcriptional regulator with XRE-family HTH domain